MICKKRTKQAAIFDNRNDKCFWTLIRTERQAGGNQEGIPSITRRAVMLSGYR